MKERPRVGIKSGVPKSIELPKDHRKIFLEKTENVIALCTVPGCKSVIFKGDDRTQIGLRVLRERIYEHIDYFENSHNLEDVDIIHPRYNSEQRIINAEELENIIYPCNYNRVVNGKPIFEASASSKKEERLQ